MQTQKTASEKKPLLKWPTILQETQNLPRTVRKQVKRTAWHPNLTSDILGTTWCTPADGLSSEMDLRALLNWVWKENKVFGKVKCLYRSFSTNICVQYNSLCTYQPCISCKSLGFSFPLTFPKTAKFYKKAHFRNCISLPKYKIFWLFLHLLSECERTFVKGSGEHCKWLSDPSKCAFVF